MKFFAITFILFSLVLLPSCMKGKKVDLVLHNARIHCLDDGNHIVQAMAIKNGKIIETGPDRQIMNKYHADEFIDCAGKDILPGITDAHGHMLYYAKQKLRLDLNSCKSYEELLVRAEKYQENGNKKFIVGAGWDQSLWGENDLPNNKKLNALFPSTPVCLYRVDGHAALVNDCLLKKIKNLPTTIDGGKIVYENDIPSGILIDNAMNLVDPYLPKNNPNEIKKAILEIQEELLAYGVTGVHEAGISYDEIKVLQDLVDQESLKLNVYAMLLDAKNNRDFAVKHGIYHHKNLTIRSFKMFVDGALGSRGALLKHDYEDQLNHRGVQISSLKEMQDLSSLCIQLNYQLNAHCIGDSANALVLNLYKNVYEGKKDHRWRIEHAQVIDPKDFLLFSQYAIFPSVQPIHAIDDSKWAEKRLGKKRLNGAYAYRSLLEQFGMLALGTDFPIASLNPFLTLFAANQRKGKDNLPMNGFEINQSLSFEQSLKGMTIWPCFAAFDENKRGSIEIGKEATFVVLKKPLVEQSEFSDNFSFFTFIKGKKVYSGEELSY